MSFYIQDTSPQSLKMLCDYINLLEKKAFDDNGQNLRQNSVSSNALQSQAVTTDKLALLAITTPLIASSAVIAEKIAQYAIEVQHISPLSVTTDAIAGQAITNDKIVSFAITADKIASNAITTDKLSANCITSDKIGANSIYAQHIAVDQILANHLAAGAVTSDAIAANVILSKHIQAEQIQTNHIATGAVTTNLLAADVGTNLDISSNTSITSRVTNTQYQSDLARIQSQLDNNIISWFYDYDPTLSNEPASLWTDNTTKNAHLGDLFYNVSSGASFRFVYTNSVYSWSQLSDSAVTKALNDAAKAQDTADHKRRVFIATPTPPYDLGDLWSGGATGDLKICIVTKAIGGVYQASDWSNATKYTDDTLATQAKTNADAANNLLADLSADNKLTQAEKNNVLTEWKTIQDEKPTLDSQAAVFSITTELTAYDNAYNALNAYITPILNASGTSDIVGDDFRTIFRNYYTAKINLINKMTSLNKSTADYAKALADTLNNTVVPGLASRVSTAEQKITPDAIISTVTTAETYLGNTKVANYANLTVNRTGMSLNPLQSYCFNGGDVFSPNTFVSTNTGNQKPIYSGDTEIIGNQIVTFTLAVDRVNTMQSQINQQSNQISLVVTQNNGTTMVNSASIVAAINNGTSKINMSAMNIDLTGLVSFNSLDSSLKNTITTANNADSILSSWTVPSKTTINGAYIESGTLKINQILVGGANGMITWGAIDKTGATAAQVGAKPYDWLPSYDVITGTKPPSNADNTTTTIGPNRLTYIDGNGIYTGTLTANQINVIQGLHLGANATIDWSQLTPPTADQVGAKAADWQPDLTAYVTNTALNSTLSNYVLTTALTNYVTQGYVSSALMNYVSNSALTTKIGYNMLLTGKVVANDIVSGTLDCMNLTVKNLQTSSLIGDIITLSNNCSLDSRGGDARLRYNSSNYSSMGNGLFSLYMGVDGANGIPDYRFDSTGIKNSLGNYILKTDGSMAGSGGTNIAVFG